MIETWLTIVSVVCLGLIFREYLPSYLREKGKNLATHEDIDKIVEELRKTTKAAEDIKAQISGGLWLGQTRWKLKHDLYVNLLEGLTDCRAMLRWTNSLLEQRRTATEESVRERLSERLRRAAERYENAVGRVRRARAMGGVFLTDEARNVLDEFNTETIAAADGAYGTPYREKLAAVIERASELLVRAAKSDLLGL
jgi:hypothetical protein